MDKLLAVLALLVAGFRPKGEELEIENAISRERDLTKARLNGFGRRACRWDGVGTCEILTHCANSEKRTWG